MSMHKFCILQSTTTRYPPHITRLIEYEQQCGQNRVHLPKQLIWLNIRLWQWAWLCIFNRRDIISHQWYNCQVKVLDGDIRESQWSELVVIKPPAWTKRKKISLHLVKENYLKAFNHSMLWVLWKLPSHKGLSRLRMQPEQNIWREIVWQHQACFKAQAYHTNTTWFRACPLTIVANFGDPKVAVEILLPMNCFSYGWPHIAHTTVV